MTWKEKLSRTFSWTEYRKDCALSKELGTGKFLCQDCYTKMLDRNVSHKMNMFRYKVIAAIIALVWITLRWLL